VARVAEGDRDPVSHGERAVVVDADKLLDRLIGILSGVKRLDRREAMLGALLGDERRVIALDFGRIFKHDAGQVARGERAVNAALEPLAAEVRQVTTVINMGVTEDDGVDLLWVERKTAIALDGFATPPLKQAALQQEPLPIQLEEIDRPGGRASSTEEMNSHGEESAASNGKVERKVMPERVRDTPHEWPITSGMPEGNPPFAQIVGRHLHVDLVSDADADEILAHLAGNMGQHLVAVRERHPEHRPWQHLRHCTGQFNWFFFRHADLS
jgi:hypothetical protein